MGIRNFIAIALLLVISTSPLYIVKANVSNNSVPIECHTYYFVEIVKVSKGSYGNVTGLELDVPTNVSLGNIVQVSKVVDYRGLIGRWIVDTSKPGISYIVTWVRICYPNSTWSVRLIRALLMIPYLYSNYSEPTKMIRKYVGEPEPPILNVSQDFVVWLSKQGIPFARMSVAGLAYHAALFVYWIYINYTPSAIPHSVEETVKTRRGDCDDMSRVLTELLWHYRIPALMVYGYVVLNLTKPFTGTLGSFSFVMPNVGPHAFVVAYLPPFGWLSLDLLAGSFIAYPFIIVGVTNNTRVSERQVSEFVEFCLTTQGVNIAFAIPATLVDNVSKLLGESPTEVLKKVVNFVSSEISSGNVSISQIFNFIKSLTKAYASEASKIAWISKRLGETSLGVKRWVMGSYIHLPR